VGDTIICSKEHVASIIAMQYISMAVIGVHLTPPVIISSLGFALCKVSFRLAVRITSIHSPALVEPGHLCIRSGLCCTDPFYSCSSLVLVFTFPNQQFELGYV
jgi:hypothetical protein